VRRFASGGDEAEYGPVVTRRPAPDGYTEAWDTEFTRAPVLAGVVVRTVYIRADAAGRASEYASCTVRASDPSKARNCRLHAKLDGAPSVYLSIGFLATQWPERESIKGQVMRMVSSWQRPKEVGR
jgi:hypothetical protein